MTQPVFLKNFTLDGFDIGTIFVTAQVTIPFLNVERGYYSVGNSDGERLKSTRLNPTTITIDGFLIRDFSGETISDTKDRLVSQIMSKETKRLIFDGLPDRYFNVVFDGTQEYDATDDSLTPLTLTFKCPEGVAHSLEPDVFRNTSSSSVNLIVDSEFSTKTYWNEDTYVSDIKRNNSNVLGLDYSNLKIEEMESTVNDMVADHVYYEDETLALGDSYTAAFDYAILKKSDADDDGTNSLEFVLEELDKQNGKVLSTKTYPLAGAAGAAGAGGQVMTAYAYNSTGLDRFTFSDQAYPNLIPLNKNSETPTLTSMGGATITATNNIAVPNWGATNAVRFVSSGGTTAQKANFASGISTVSDVTYTSSIYVKNNSTTDILNITNNVSNSVNLLPLESRRLDFKETRGADQSSISLQWIFRAPTVNSNIDVTVWRAKISASSEIDQWTNANDGLTVDNTTPGFVGYSTTDNDSPSNLLLNGSLSSNTNYWDLSGGISTTQTGDYTTLNSQATTYTKHFVSSNNQGLTGALGVGKEYVLSGDFFIEGGYSGDLEDTRLTLRVSYSDNSVQDINTYLSNIDVGAWVNVSTSGLVQNKTIKGVEAFLFIGSNFVGNIRIRKFKLEEGSVATPFAPHVTERGALYSWYAYGTGYDISTTPLTRSTYTFQIENVETKLLRLSWNVIGNSHALLNRPTLRKGSVGTYVASAKEYLQAIEIENNGTWKTYPTFEINNINDNGTIGIVNEFGDVLQFGNPGDSDSKISVNDEFGFNVEYNSTSRPANFAINAGHVSNFPYVDSDPSRPNSVGGGFNFTGNGSAKPYFPTTGLPNAWRGPTLTSPVSAPTGGDRTGAFEYVEHVDFKTDGEKMGVFEDVVITNSNDIMMGIIVRDSTNLANEIFVEYWYGNRKLFTEKQDISKYKTATFRYTMRRDASGKQFSWNFENVQRQSNGQYTSVTSKFYQYNSPTANKSEVNRTSRWWLSYGDGKFTRDILRGVRWSHKVKVDNVAIHKDTNTNSQVFSRVPKGVVFNTTHERSAQKVVNNNLWYLIVKDTGNRIQSTGWVAAYYLEQLSRREDRIKETVDAITDMKIWSSKFIWRASGIANVAKNPFKAGDVVYIDTFSKTIVVNGVERNDLASIGNQWNGFAFDSGTHYLRFLNSDWATDTMEVTVSVNKTFL